MLDVRVHAAVAEQSEEMQLPCSSALHRLLKQRHALQLLIRNQQINTRDVHVHDAPRAHVHVSHFAIAHLPFGQPDKWPGSMNQCVGESFDQFVIRRFPSQGDGIPLGLRAVSPSIEHRQHNRFRSFCHSASEYMDLLDESLCFRHDIQGSVPWLMKEIRTWPLRKRLAQLFSTTAKSFAGVPPLKLSWKWLESSASTKTDFSPFIVPRAIHTIAATSPRMIIGSSLHAAPASPLIPIRLKSFAGWMWGCGATSIRK